MPRIVPHLWFDTQAVEAAQMYTSIFANAEITSTAVLEGTPGQDSQSVSFRLAGQGFAAINGGPHFQFNPAISLMVQCKTKEEVDAKWDVLSKDGMPLMPLGSYPFSQWYGWVQDRYGLSWQLMLADDEKIEQQIRPSFLFSQDVCGLAEEAIEYYVSVFPQSELKFISRYGSGEALVDEAKVNFAEFTLAGMDFVAMDNGTGGNFPFNEAFSFMVNCSSQEEIDFFWHRLSAVPEAEQCGWLKDKYGVSWQIVPEDFDEILKESSPEERSRMIQAFLGMKKIDLAAMERARRG
jgi:predicted 3-demethylubiquinone-9 3-methyltransferase (glyoxalase superfamily)